MANEKEKNLVKDIYVDNNEIDVQDWKFFINRASEVIKVYENQTEYFVKMIVSFVVYYNILFVIYNALSRMILSSMLEIIIVAILYGIYLVYSVKNILDITNKGDTKGTVSSIYFYKNNKLFKKNNEGKIIHKVTKDCIKEEYPKTMYNLLKYQKNYFNIAKDAKKLFKRNIKIFLAFISISLLVIIIIV